MVSQPDTEKGEPQSLGRVAVEAEGKEKGGSVPGGGGAMKNPVRIKPPPADGEKDAFIHT